MQLQFRIILYHVREDDSLVSGESHRPLTPILLKNIAIHVPFLSRYFCKIMSSSRRKIVYTPPICITMRLPFVSRCFCRSIRVRGRWNTPNCNLKRFLGWLNKTIIRADFREGDEDSNFSVFRVWRFSEWPEPLH